MRIFGNIKNPLINIINSLHSGASKYISTKTLRSDRKRVYNMEIVAEPHCAPFLLYLESINQLIHSYFTGVLLLAVSYI